MDGYCNLVSVLHSNLHERPVGYQVIPQGRQIATAAIAASNATVNLLIPKAA